MVNGLHRAQIGGNATRYYTNGDGMITLFAVFGNWVDIRTKGACVVR